MNKVKKQWKRQNHIEGKFDDKTKFGIVCFMVASIYAILHGANAITTCFSTVTSSLSIYATSKNLTVMSIYIYFLSLYDSILLIMWIVSVNERKKNTKMLIVMSLIDCIGKVIYNYLYYWLFPEMRSGIGIMKLPGITDYALVLGWLILTISTSKVAKILFTIIRIPILVYMVYTDVYLVYNSFYTWMYKNISVKELIVNSLDSTMSFIGKFIILFLIIYFLRPQWFFIDEKQMKPKKKSKKASRAELIEKIIGQEENKA